MHDKGRAGPLGAGSGGYRSAEDHSASLADVQRQLAQLADCVFDPTDLIEIRRLPSGRSTWHRASELAGLASQLITDNRNGQNLYVGANPRTRSGGRSASDVVLARSVFADFDDTEPAEAQSRWQAAGLPTPTLVVASGHGVHAYWRLVEPIAPSEQTPDCADTSIARGWEVWSSWQRDLAASLGSDPCVHDAPRIMRLPGFINHKPPAAPAYIVDADSTRVFELAELHERIPERPATTDIPDPAHAGRTTAKAPCRRDVPARATKYAAQWPGVAQGGRNTAAVQHAAQLVRDFGLSDAQAWPILVAWNERNDPPLDEAELRKCLVNAGKYCTKKPIGCKAERTLPSVGSSLPPTDTSPPLRWQPFPTALFPEPVRTYVQDSAKSIGCDESYVAVAILGALAGAVGGARSVYIKSVWFQPCILWCMFVGESGTMKDAALRAAVLVIQDKEIEAHKQHRKAMAQYVDAQERYKDELRQWKRETKEPGIAGVQPQPPVRPVCRRFLIDDITIEALAVTLEENPRGVLAAYCELSSWFRAGGEYKHGRGSDDLKWLKTYDAAFLQADRKNEDRPRVVVPHATVSVVGGIQPGILRGELIQRRFESGCVARFWIVYPPEDKVVQWSDFEGDDRAYARVREIFLGLLDLKPDADGKPEVVRLSNPARQMFRDYARGEHTQDIQTSTGFLRASYAKDKGRVARLALLLHLVKTVRHNHRPTDPLMIEEDTMHTAIALVRWFKRETARVYALLGGTGGEDPATRKLVEFIEGKNGVVSPRDVVTGCRWIRTSSDAKAQLQRLVDAGFGRWEHPKPGGKGGAPTILFYLSSHTTVCNTAIRDRASDGSADADAADNERTKNEGAGE